VVKRQGLDKGHFVVLISGMSFIVFTILGYPDFEFKEYSNLQAKSDILNCFEDPHCNTRIFAVTVF